MKNLYLIKTIKLVFKRINEGLLKSIIKQTKWIYSYASKYRRSIIIYTLLGFFETAVTLLISLASKNLVDIITGHQSVGLIKTFSLVIGLSIANIFISQISSYASNIISIKVDNDIKADVFDKMLITELEAINGYTTGDLLTRWSTDASNISNALLNWLPNLFINLVKFIASLCIVIYYDASFALFAMLSIPCGIIVSKSMLSKIRENNKRSVEMSSHLTGFNQEAFSNIQTLKAFNMLKLYSTRLNKLQNDYLNVRKDYLKLSSVATVIMSFAGLLVSYSCYGWGIYRVWSGAITYGTMTMFLSLSSYLSGSLNSLISLVPTAITLSTSATRINDILDMPKEDFSKDDIVKAIYEKHKNEGISLVINKLKYSYPNGTEVFCDCSMEMHPHEIIGLVGPSGEGKTTMLRIILALLHPKEGECVLYSGINNKEQLPYTPSIRQLFSYVPQGNTMFYGTIRDNLLNVKPNATEDELIQVLKLACAWEFVMKLPDGLNAKIGERGLGFSEGQSQRLSIARALLRKSPILLLDEATSALDVATERKVLKNISKDNYPKICIVTSHRPSVLSLCNRVYEINNKTTHILTKQEIEKRLNDF